ncbi:MAG: PD-(D/E)XK nuclease family protein [Agarilytica sp.]
MKRSNMRGFDSLFESTVSCSSGGAPIVSPGTLVLAPNQRLGRFIQDEYAQFQRQAEAEAWPTYPCHSFTTWVESLWEDFLSSSPDAQPLLINSAQEDAIWLEVLRRRGDPSDKGEGIEDIDLFNPAATASECRRAWNMLVRWNIAAEAQPSIAKEFSTWLAGYRAYCDEQGLIDQPSMVERLIGYIAGGKVAIPRRVVLVAFDDITPQMQSLLDCVKTLGGVIEEYAPEMEASSQCRVVAQDGESEVLSAAMWAENILRNTPDVRIGIVVPQLLSQRVQVERVFTDVFEPQYKLPDSPRHASPFNMSAGISLNAAPPIAMAILSLKLNFHSLDIEDIDKILHSPFVGVQAEVHSRALLAEQLRAQYEEVRVSGFRTAVGEFTTPAVDSRSSKNTSVESVDENTSLRILPDFYERLQAFQKIALSATIEQSPSVWGELFCRQWQALGWPGNRSLDTLEYQQVEVWQKTITELGRFDYIFPSVSLNQAIELLERLAFATQFQAQTLSSPVQVLGLFEAAGLTFDYLWVMNLDNEAWPSPIRPNAFLPLSLQKEHSMPLASVERELTLARRITERFKKSCSHLVMSHHEMDGDKLLEVSPLIGDLSLADLSDVLGGAQDKSSQRYCDVIFESRDGEAIEDAIAPLVDDASGIRGGSQILKDQAACPFKAFATHRLHAKSAEEYIPGISAALRGSLIHRALELVWKALESHASLVAHTEQELDELVDECIARSFTITKDGHQLGARLKQLESERMSKLLHAWLALETQRAAFVVRFNESKKRVMIGDLPINIRFDRIDQLDDGSAFVLDYKTGKVDIRSWAGDRPDEPQVPLYAIANKKDVSGVAFGQLNSDAVAFKGLAEDADVAPGISGVGDPDDKNTATITRLGFPEQWPDLISQWQRILESLACEFTSGAADVNPKSKSVSCQYCHLQSLCRIRHRDDVLPDENGAVQ